MQEKSPSGYQPNLRARVLLVLEGVALDSNASRGERPSPSLGARLDLTEDVGAQDVREIRRQLEVV